MCEIQKSRHFLETAQGTGCLSTRILIHLLISGLQISFRPIPTCRLYPLCALEAICRHIAQAIKNQGLGRELALGFDCGSPVSRLSKPTLVGAAYPNPNKQDPIPPLLSPSPGLVSLFHLYCAFSSLPSLCLDKEEYFRTTCRHTNCLLLAHRRIYLQMYPHVCMGICLLM